MKNSKLTREKVRHVAKLANLVLTEVEIEKFQKQLSGVFDYVGQLKGVETKNIEPLAHATDSQNAMREDKALTGLTAQEAIANAKNTYNNLFKVPAIQRLENE